MVKTIKIPLFTPCKITFVQENDFESIAKKHNVDGSVENYLGYAFRKKEFHYYVVVTNPCKVSILAHEIKHAINFMLEDIGIKLDTYNDELECYLLEYVIEQACKKLIVNLQ